jgi:putative phosphoribosyl transferase
LHVPTDGVVLEGRLHLPAQPRAVVIHSTVRRAGQGDDGVPDDASSLVERGFAVLTVDVLRPAERSDPRMRLDAFLLARRLEAVAGALERQPVTKTLRIAHVANGPTAAGALIASLGDSRIAAIVSRRGRPDLADGILHQVTVPTLLLTDSAGLPVNAAAHLRFRCRTELTVADDHAESRSSWDGAVLDWLSRHVSPIGRPVPDRRTRQRLWVPAVDRVASSSHTSESRGAQAQAWETPASGRDRSLAGGLLRATACTAGSLRATSTGLAH